MSQVPFEHLNIYLPYGLRKLGVKIPHVIALFQCLKIFSRMDGGWMDGWNHFSSFSSYIGMQKFLWVLKFGQVGVWGTKIPNSPYLRRFQFIVQNFIFCRAGCLFWYIYYYFFIKQEFTYKLKRCFIVELKQNSFVMI